jgi:hypothetical protein
LWIIRIKIGVIGAKVRPIAVSWWCLSFSFSPLLLDFWLSMRCDPDFPEESSFLESLWPDFDLEGNVVAPLTILREQANFLSKRTGQRIIGIVTALSRKPGGPDFSYLFSIGSPLLNNYQHDLFRLDHGIAMYPATLQPGNVSVRDEAELCNVLKAAFSSQETRKVISALLTQVKATERNPT